MAVPPFLFQPKLIWYALLYANYRFYEFDGTSFQNFKKKIQIFFGNLIPFEILFRFPTIDSSHWLRKDVQWIVDKVFREKMV